MAIAYQRTSGLQLFDTTGAEILSRDETYGQAVDLTIAGDGTKLVSPITGSGGGGGGSSTTRDAELNLFKDTGNSDALVFRVFRQVDGIETITYTNMAGTAVTPSDIANLQPVANSSANSGTLATTTATGSSGSIIAGYKFVSFELSNDFVGVINGRTIDNTNRPANFPERVRILNFGLEGGIDNALAYTITSGLAIITEIR